MSFAYPEFLFALAAVSVPIIIHLFNFRRFKKVYFSDIRFLKDVEIETKSRNKLKNLLILLSRILAIAFLALAFARPFIPTKNGLAAQDSNSVVVYIDNSFSMNADGASGNLLEEAKAKAIEIGSVYANGAQLRLLTNDFDPQHIRNLSFEEFKNEVTKVSASPQVRSFDDILTRTSGILGAGEAASIYFISDLQRTTCTPLKSPADSALNVFVVPTRSVSEENIYIDSCWFDSPSRLPLQPDLLRVRIRNSGNETVENVSVKLTINSIQRAVGVTTIASKSFEDVELPFTNAANGLQLAEVSIQDYPIIYDDHYYLSFKLADQVNILCLNGESASKSVMRVYDSEASFKLTETSSTNLDYSVLSSTDLVICNGIGSFSSGMVQELMRFVETGGSLLFVPAERADLSSTNELLLAIGAEQLTSIDTGKLKVEGVNLKSRIFKNVFTEWQERIDLPNTSKHYGSSMNTSVMAERLLTLANGQPLLTSYSKGKGTSYVLSSVLKDEWTNFHRHALFVPTFYNIALNSIFNAASSETIGSDDFISIESSSKELDKLEVRNLANDMAFMPERVVRMEGNGILVHDQIKSSGHYLAMNQKDTLRSISFNYNRAESDLAFLETEDLKKLAEQLGIKNLQVVEGNTESISNQVNELHNGKQLWRLFLVLALLCLLTETILIRIL